MNDNSPVSRRQAPSTPLTQQTGAPADAPASQTAAQEGARLPTSNAVHTQAVDAGPKPQIRAGAEKIGCPFLATAYNQGQLNPDPKTGIIDVDQMNKLMAWAGFDPAGSKVFVDAADKADPESGPGKFNLFGMRGNSMNHKGSSGMRDMKVDPERIGAVMAFAKDGKLDKEAFGRAANASIGNEVGQGSALRGTAIQTLEYTTLLQLFGRGDDKHVTAKDVEGLWFKNVYPEGWKPGPPNSIKLGDLMGNTATMGLSRVWSAVKAFFAKLFG